MRFGSVYLLRFGSDHQKKKSQAKIPYERFKNVCSFDRHSLSHIHIFGTVRFLFKLTFFYAYLPLYIFICVCPFYLFLSSSIWYAHAHELSWFLTKQVLNHERCFKRSSVWFFFVLDCNCFLFRFNSNALSKETTQLSVVLDMKVNNRKSLCKTTFIRLLKLKFLRMITINLCLWSVI